MMEILLVFMLLLGLIGFVGLFWVPWEPLLVVGVLLLLLGGFGCVPASVLYHLRLHAVLAPRNGLPRRWWLSPTRLHAGLQPGEWALVKPWFTLGVASFCASVLGGVMALVAAWRGR